MKKLNLLKTMFLLCALMVGSSAWADDETLTIGFEEASYTDWQLANIKTQSKNSAVPAHSGSYYGGTDGKESGSVVTSAKIESPKSVTFYISKESTNTNAGSVWIVKVSADGETWEEVGDNQAAAAGITKGEWTEVTRNLSDYSDVYVGVFYSGTSAKRCIDDITVTYESGDDPGTPTCVTPTFSPAAGTYTSAQNVTISTETEGATIHYTTDGTDPTALSATYSSAISVTATTTIKAIAVMDGYDNSSIASATYTIVTIEHAGTQDDPYTVADARVAIDANIGVTNVYAKGIVSEIVTPFDSGYGNISYNISTDGLTTSDQLQAFRGKSYNGEKFTSEDDIQVGDEVVIYGNLTKYNSTYEFAQNNQLVSLVRPQSKKNAGLAFTDKVEEGAYAMYFDTEVTANTLYTVTSDGAISYTSSAEEVAVVEEGVLKAKKSGTSTITISVAETDEYKAASISFALTVTTRPAVQPEGPAGGNFSKITSTDDLTDGDYLIVYEEGNVAFNGSLETLDAVNNTIEVEISENAIAATDETKAAIFTIDVTAGTLMSKSGLYIGVTTNSNGLKQSEDATAYKNVFSIDDNEDAVIKADFQSSNMTMRYNYASNQQRFRYYGNGQQPIQLYKLIETPVSTFDISIDSKGDGWRTIVTSVSATLPDGLTAYKASVSNDKVVLEPVASLKANNAYILKGAVGNYTLTVTNSPEEPTGNELEISTETDGNGVFVLAKKNGVVGFYKWTGGALGAGRVILPASVASSAREFLAFDEGETTGISATLMNNEKVNNEVYNLNGQRVAQPTKGLYIVNGKKYIIK